MNQRTQKQITVLGVGVMVLLMLFIYGNMDHQTVTDERQTETKENPKQIPEQVPEQVPKPKATGASLRLAKPGGNPEIRVLICADNYESKYHQEITLECTTDYTVQYGDVTEEHTAKEKVWLTPEDPWLTQGSVTLTPKTAAGKFSIPGLQRSQKNPSYPGIFRIEKKAEGLQVINQLPLETYLGFVVPSEMPAAYPLEALKAQAVCARTYALKHILAGRKKKAAMDVDDSVSYQVYNNIGSSKRTRKAVKETAGVVLMKGEELVETLYYSTSCGIDLSGDFSEEAVFASFIMGSSDKAYEKEEPWYRWSTYYSLAELTHLAQTGGQEQLGTVKEMTIAKREASGVIGELEIVGAGGRAVIEGEYAVRMFLQTNNAPVTLQNGSEAPNLRMLPSAFFYLIPDYDGEVLKGYEVIGGGYGHGKGMSQNGARHMADAGKTCEEILNYYYGMAKAGENE